MKKVFSVFFIFALVFVLSPSIGNAAQEKKGVQNKNQVQAEKLGEANGQQGIHEAGTGLENPELKEDGQGTGQALSGASEKAETRRSRVSTAVQQMERIATNNKGIGEQVRVIARSQNRLQEEMEFALEKTQERGAFSKFLIGPNYQKLDVVELGLKENANNLKELKGLKGEVKTSADQELLDLQISAMEEIRAELEGVATQERKGFSLFGWLNRLFSK